ncbi:hypothetical protein Ciccas_004277 [Cichlidogyrus casuarinus]|uniref:Uncharacterized protein n=1 Tax=Cichlidogyrus casuarinus TaxID=1844966 RepID=A0ABD2QC04_9PLAT
MISDASTGCSHSDSSLNSEQPRNAVAVAGLMTEFEVEHLSTFTTAIDRPPPNTKATLDKLRQLRQNKNLVITRCVLQLQEQPYHSELVVKGSNNDKVIERFKLNTIRDPIYKISNDPAETLNNLVLFSINAQSGTLSNKHEQHIFQCLNCPANILVEEILRHQQLDTGESPPSVKKTISDITPRVEDEEEIVPMLLNHCFTDIEELYFKSIARLRKNNTIKLLSLMNDISLSSKRNLRKQDASKFKKRDKISKCGSTDSQSFLRVEFKLSFSFARRNRFPVHVL